MVFASESRRVVVAKCCKEEGKRAEKSLPSNASQKRAPVAKKRI